MADLVLLIHVAFVAFVVGGLAAIWLGNARGWAGVNARAFRVAHLVAIAFVVIEAWLGAVCPLTALERWLRTRVGAPTYAVEESFVGHWLSRVLYWDAPAWVFTAVYTVFGLLVLSTWWRFPPRVARSAPGRRASAPRA